MLPGGVIDTHLHVWDLSGGGYQWLGPEHGELHRSFLPDEAATVLARHGVERAVLVQAEDSTADTDHLLDVARGAEWALGVVGWVPLEQPEETVAELDRLATTPLVGIRHLVHDDPRDDFLDLYRVRTSLAEVAARGLVLDVPDAWPRHLDAIGRVADTHPGLTVVVDHLAKPPRGRADLPAWEESMRRIARRPNTVAKLSGLQTPGQPLTSSALRPVVDVALEAFTPARLMYGGDWPMTIPFGGYGQALGALRPLVEELSTDEQAAIWRGTALRTYGTRAMAGGTR